MVLRKPGGYSSRLANRNSTRGRPFICVEEARERLGTGIIGCSAISGENFKIHLWMYECLGRLDRLARQVGLDDSDRLDPLESAGPPS